MKSESINSLRSTASALFFLLRSSPGFLETPGGAYPKFDNGMAQRSARMTGLTSPWPFSPCRYTTSRPCDKIQPQKKTYLCRLRTLRKPAHSPSMCAALGLSPSLPFGHGKSQAPLPTDAQISNALASGNGRADQERGDLVVGSKRPVAPPFGLPSTPGSASAGQRAVARWATAALSTRPRYLSSGFFSIDRRHVLLCDT